MAAALERDFAEQVHHAARILAGQHQDRIIYEPFVRQPPCQPGVEAPIEHGHRRIFVDDLRAGIDIRLDRIIGQQNLAKSVDRSRRETVKPRGGQLQPPALVGIEPGVEYRPERFRNLARQQRLDIVVDALGKLAGRRLCKGDSRRYAQARCRAEATL